MNTFSRRRFLVYMGEGVVVIAGGTAFTLRQLTGKGQGNILKFRAITGLPTKPTPSYASYVIGGQVNLNTTTGAITKNVFAGPPAQTTNIALLTRSVRVTGVEKQGSKWHITGVVNNQAQIQVGEEKTFSILLDPNRNLAQSTFFGSPIQLTLQNFTTPSSESA
jgi:hypothetical protein